MFLKFLVLSELTNLLLQDMMGKKNTCKQTKNIEMGGKEAEFLWLILENFKDIVTASVFVVKCQACESIR